MAPASTIPEMKESPTAKLPDFDSLPDRYGWPRQNSSGYRIKEQLCGTERPLRVISLGAGVSGINLAKLLPGKVNNIALTIYEKNPEVGGTWYPGVACDIPSNNYQFTWAKNPRWKHFYSEGAEILQYFKDVVEEFDLRKHFVFSHEVLRAEWIEDRGLWKVQVRNTCTGEVFDDYGEIFINNGGLLNNWRWPDIEGLQDFKGLKCHTAQWDDSIDYRNKRVAVIGTGSSGVQVIPYIAPDVSQLFTWIRSSTWITAGFAQQYAGAGGTNFEYTEEQKQYWTDHPLEYQHYCKEIESELNQRFKFILNGSPAAEEAKKFSTQQMKQKLGSRSDIAEKLIPTTFGVGCRRPTPGNGFLESLTLPNVHVFTEVPQRITAGGFVDHEGKEHEVDIIICATGFDTSWIPRFPVIAHGRNVQDLHREKLLSYLSLAVPDIPNYFTICGPYGPFGHGSYIAMSELLVRNIAAVTKKIQKENIKSVRPRRDVCEKFAEHADLYLQRTAWSGPCPSWFKNGQKDGRLTMWPGSRLVYFDVLDQPRYEDYVIDYWSGNPFEFLGNGFALIEFNGGDLSHYLGTRENPGGVLSANAGGDMER
ncbi:hypothetical protein FE257_008056 [Aspergillus nanangensis]|uniref:Uncharacterized protein n=1 Tax=Aspergillus nanangensis TaxID=2582783 RepID=A0AAD4GT19_ASPNN|nr:hypothetical protein FE257_008056 [Aspergillus nanangensis]